MNDVTEVIAIVDRSGSMSSIKDDAIGGFNAFLDGQKKCEGRANFTHVQFDDKYEIVCNGIDVKDAKPYTIVTYLPRGSTALLDAVGKTINDVSARMDKLPENERAQKVIMAILTDGHENASHEFNNEQVKKLVENKKSSGWEFVFIAAGINEFDAKDMGNAFGISSNRIMSVSHDSKGMSNAYNSLGTMTCSYRTSGTIDDGLFHSRSSTGQHNKKRRIY